MAQSLDDNPVEKCNHSPSRPLHPKRLGQLKDPNIPTRTLGHQREQREEPRRTCEPRQPT